MTEQEAKRLEVPIEWNGKANVCTYCGRVPETFYVATGHDHTDYDIRWCVCRDGTQYKSEIETLRTTITEQEQRIAQLEEALKQLDFRGYAALGTGQYLLNACPATAELPAELVISIATEAEKEGRVIGDLKDVTPGTIINPDAMAVRLAFFSVAGLDALEQQLRILREESFPDSVEAINKINEVIG